MGVQALRAFQSGRDHAMMQEFFQHGICRIHAEVCTDVVDDPPLIRSNDPEHDTPDGSPIGTSNEDSPVRPGEREQLFEDREHVVLDRFAWSGIARRDTADVRAKIEQIEPSRAAHLDRQMQACGNRVGALTQFHV